MSRSIPELAQEALDIQNACNPLGLTKSYAKALSELMTALGDEASTRAINESAINRM